MKSRRVTTLWVIAGGLLLTYGVATALGAFRVADAGLGSTQVVAATKAFGLKALPIEMRTIPGPLGSRYEVPLDDGAIACLDAQGRVTDVNGIVASVAPSSEPNRRAAAESAARAFVGSRHPRFPKMDLVYENELNPGVYRLHWQEVAASGALLPSFVSVIVDTNLGEIGSYNARYESTTVDTEPGISRGQMLAKLGDDGARQGIGPGDLELRVCVDRNGRQLLTWKVRSLARKTVDSDMDQPPAAVYSGSIVFYDADTGDDVTEMVAGANF